MQEQKLLAQEKPFIIGMSGFIWQALFFYVPLVFVIVLSVVRLSDTHAYTNFTTAFYSHFLQSTYLTIIIKSLGLALITSCLCFLLGYPIAHFLSFKAGKYKTFFLFLLIVPFWTNFLLHIYAWFFVLERSGFLNNSLLYLGLIKQPLHLLNTLGAVIALMVYSYLPFMVLPIYSVLERFDKKLLEASADLGAHTWQTWKRIVLPLALTGIQSGFFLVFVPAFSEFVIPGIVGGEKYVFVGTVISQYILGNRTLSLGAAFTVLSSLALIVFVKLAGLLVKKIFTYKGAS